MLQSILLADFEPPVHKDTLVISQQAAPQGTQSPACINRSVSLPQVQDFSTIPCGISQGSCQSIPSSSQRAALLLSSLVMQTKKCISFKWVHYPINRIWLCTYAFSIQSIILFTSYMIQTLNIHKISDKSRYFTGFAALCFVTIGIHSLSNQSNWC